jgi:class 3 adenylate cyclase
MGGVAIVVFCDLVDSTALLARLGDDRMEAVRRRHVGDVSDAVVAAGGRVVKLLGDGAMASFDSALGALRAAVAIQSAVARLDGEHGGLGIAARVGIAAGEPIADGEDLHGMPVVIASRLCSAAGSGEVLVQELVRELVASRDATALDEALDYALKGVPRPVRASRLRWRELASAPTSAVVRAREDATSASTDGRSPVGIPLPRVLAAYAGEPLIGRDREIAALREATASGSGCRAVLVLGEPGIGKTRHAAAAAAEAHARGAVVVLARCPPEPAIAFEPWVRAIGELALAGDEAWRVRLAEAAGAELAALVPELGTGGGLAGAVAGVAAAEGARYRLLRGIGAALACGAGGAPLFVVLDDAHWCDPASAEALRHLLQSPSIGELVLVVTARDRELGRGHVVSRVLADLRRTRDLSELRLSGLDAHGVAALVGERVGRVITPRLASQLHARTAGNPFFAAELARDLDERGALRDDEALSAAPAPDAVADLVEERLARLDAPTARLLVAAAAIGPSAPVALAARAAELDEDGAARAVQAALFERLVDEVPAAEPTIAFPHALVREALRARTGGADRARVHLAIGDALAQKRDVEPAELARHAGLAVPLTGPAPAIAAHRRAADAAATRHDHEQAAAHLQGALALVADDDLAARAPLLLALGEQQLLAADLMRARGAFRAACAAARATADPVTLAQAALGFAGGYIGFGWETGLDDEATVPLLQEGLDALGEREPMLALRMTLRLATALVFTADDAQVQTLVARAQALGARCGDDEALVVTCLAEVAGRFARGRDPLDISPMFDQILAVREAAERCGRDELVFRVAMAESVVHYLCGRPAKCDEAIERATQVAARLGSPRFVWEAEQSRGCRLLERGERAAGEALLRSAGAKVRLLRPDIHMTVELFGLGLSEWFYEGRIEPLLDACRARDLVRPMPFISATMAWALALMGDQEGARRRLTDLLADDGERLRGPDGHVPAALMQLANAAVELEDRSVVPQLRAMLEPLRGLVLQVPPMTLFGQVTEWHIGRLELLAGRPDAAVDELRAAVARADAIELPTMSGWARVELAVALHRCGEVQAARATLAEADALADQIGLSLIAQKAAIARAELEGREPPPAEHALARPRALRAITARTGRRALAAMVRGLNDAALEQRFAEPRRQRALLRAQARAFQPSEAGDLHAVVVFELEPFAIEAPPDAPWRWAIELDGPAGRARLVEPAPLDGTVTIHFGLADWVRTTAGLQSPLHAMVAGRCSVEGDVRVAARLESIFGVR